MSESDVNSHVRAIVNEVIRPHIMKIANETARRPLVALEIEADDRAVGASTLDVDSESKADPLSFRGRVSLRRTGDTARIRFHVQLILDDRLTNSSYSGIEASGTTYSSRAGELELRISQFAVLNNVWSWLPQ